MRVLQVTAIPVTALRFVTPLARALADCGHEVAFATGPGRGGDALRAEGFTVHRVPISRNVLDWRNRGATRQLRYLVESRGYDVVHAHTPAAGTVARIAARKSAAARLYTMHGSLWGRGVDRGRQGLYTLLEWALGHTTDLVFTVNSEDAADCVVRARIPESRIVKLPCGGAGVDPSFFVDDATLKLLRHEGREEFGLRPEDPLIVYVGRTVAAKGMGVLARAFARLNRQHRDARLLIVGAPLEGDRRPYNEERIRREVGKEAADNVFWAGFQDDVRRYLAAADVVVLASHRGGRLSPPPPAEPGRWWNTASPAFWSPSATTSPSPRRCCLWCGSPSVARAWVRPRTRGAGSASAERRSWRRIWRGTGG